MGFRFEADQFLFQDITGWCQLLNHPHVESATFAVVLIMLLYGACWLLGYSLPVVIFALPTPLVLFAGIYGVLYLLFYFLWNQ